MEFVGIAEMAGAVAGKYRGEAVVLGELCQRVGLFPP